MSHNDSIRPDTAQHTPRFAEASTPTERREVQQRIIGNLGLLALSGASLDTLMVEVTQRVCDGLGTSYCTILQVEAGKERLRQRASCRPAPEGAGRTTSTRSPITAVSTEDFASELRFDGTAVTARNTPTIGISVVIPQGRVRPWGVLAIPAAHSRVPFSADDVNFCQSMANVLGMVLERGRQDEERGQQDAVRVKQDEERWRVEHMLQNLMDNSSAVVCVKGLDGKYLFVNRECERVCGLTPERVARGITDYDVFDTATADELQANDRRVLQNRQSISVEETVTQGGVSRTCIAPSSPSSVATARSMAWAVSPPTLQSGKGRRRHCGKPKAG